MGYAYAVFDGEKSTLDDWGLMLSAVEISDPEPQVVKIDVPGRNGPIDLSEVLTGQVNYNNRTIRLSLDAIAEYDGWPRLRAQISNYLHGRVRSLALDSDPGYYWRGRFTVDHSLTSATTAQVVITGSVDPYKYDAETTEIAATSGATVSIYGSRMPVVPTITADSAGTVTFGGATYSLAIGLNLIPGVYLVEGENVLVFSGGGNITISYRGGSL